MDDPLPPATAGAGATTDAAWTRRIVAVCAALVAIAQALEYLWS